MLLGSSAKCSGSVCLKAGWRYPTDKTLSWQISIRETNCIIHWIVIIQHIALSTFEQRGPGFLLYVTVMHVKERKKLFFSKYINITLTRGIRVLLSVSSFFHDNFTTQTMFELLRTEKTKDKMQQLDKYGTKRSTCCY